MNRSKFEKFALDGPEREWVAMLFWPQFIAQMLLLAADVIDWIIHWPTEDPAINGILLGFFFGMITAIYSSFF